VRLRYALKKVLDIFVRGISTYRWRLYAVISI